MLVYTIRRLLLSIPVLFAVLVITFTLGFYGPGDPLTIFFDETLPPDPAVLARLREYYGLDRPYYVQLADYTWDLLRGDWGTSLTTRRPVWESFKNSLPISAQIGGAAFIVLVVIGIPLGVLAAIKQNTGIDYWIIAFSIGVRSVPIFVLGPLLMILLVLVLKVMNTPVGWDGIFNQKAVLPVLLMAAGPLLGVVRLMRGGVVEVLSQNYVRTARAKGLRERMVVSRHMVKNALTPVFTSMGMTLSGLITGALFVELIFAIPGFAGIGINAFRTRDYPIILGTTLIGAFIIVVANLLVDLGYGILDPRIRYE